MNFANTHNKSTNKLCPIPEEMNHRTVETRYETIQKLNPYNENRQVDEQSPIQKSHVHRHHDFLDDSQLEESIDVVKSFYKRHDVPIFDDQDDTPEDNSSPPQFTDKELGEVSSQLCELALLQSRIAKEKPSATTHETARTILTKRFSLPMNFS